MNLWPALVIALCGCGKGGGGAAPTTVAGLCVTKGAVAPEGDVLRIDDPTVRAVAPGSAGDQASLRFTYRGETKKTVALASGQVRRQIGLKLRGADGCNVVYVMWRFEPKPGIEVSFKRNPGKRTHAECGTGGYQKVAADDPVPVAAPAPGETHTLAATIRGDVLEATIDGDLVWRGTLDAAVRDLAGPAGLRTDNVAADVTLAAPGRADHAASPGCPRDSD